jgi:two-component system phosphate regulon sensor histidine kinase PhoR
MTLHGTAIKQILNELQELVLLLDDERQILFMNKTAIALFGEGFVGRNFVRLLRHADVMKTIIDVSEGKKEASIKVALENPVKGVFNFKVTKLEQDPQQPQIILVSIKDLTDLANAEQMRTDFVANVSHELRSPLTALSGFIETIKGPAKEDVPARERFLGLMELEASRMVRLISDLLSLSKVEARQSQRPTTQVDLAELTKRVVTTLSNAAVKENKRIHVNIEGKSEPLPVFEDEITQVLINLIENAIKYSAPDSEISVSIRTNKHIAGFTDRVLSISVEDQGEGIAREHLPRLTERFYRVDTHRSRDKGGTGLGLAIVKHIINQHRGRLHIASVEGKGSVFTIHLPYRD